MCSQQYGLNKTYIIIPPVGMPMWVFEISQELTPRLLQNISLHYEDVFFSGYVLIGLIRS